MESSKRLALNAIGNEPRREYTEYVKPDPSRDVSVFAGTILVQMDGDVLKAEPNEARLLGLALIRAADQADEEGWS